MSDQFDDFCKTEIEPLLEQVKAKLRSRRPDTNFLFMILERIGETDNAVSYVDYNIDNGTPLKPFADLIDEGEWLESETRSSTDTIN